MKKLLLIGALFAFVHPAFAADSKSVSELNDLLGGEISAVETYRQVVEKIGSDPAAKDIRDSLANHRENVEDIRAEVLRLGGTPSTDSGAWGLWAKTVTGSAKLLGDATALKALKEGEEHGIKEYQEALVNPAVPQSFKAKIKDDFLPKQREHLLALNDLIKKVS